MRRYGSLAALLVPFLAFSGSAGEEPARKDIADSFHLKPAEPPGAKLEESIRRGVAFLLKDQNKDGSWGSPTRTKGLDIYAPVPGAHHAFCDAVTALCVSALIETGGKSDEVRRAIERGEAYLMENLPKLRRATPDTLYNIWGHGYGIQALVRMHERLPRDHERRRKLKELIREQMELLERYESVDGGWGYYDFRAGTKRPATDSTPFQTASILVAFHESKQIGVEPPAKLIRSSVASIIRQRKPDFTYLYGEYLKWEPMMGINRPGGSLGRSQACNIALRLWGDKKVTDEVLETWLARLIARNLWLDMGRKRPIPHESHFQVAGYFYYFGHYYAALCIEQLPPPGRPFYQDHLAQVLLRLQEEDGSWWDFPLYNYHQQYGTAFGLMTLHRCRTPSPADAAHHEEWCRFRGPNGSGCSTASTVPQRWTEQDYNWRISLPGIGHSSPVIWGPRIFVTSADEKTGQGFVVCLRADSGQRLWLREFPGTPHRKHEDNSFATATPAVDEQRLYVVWGGPREFLTVALDHDGKELWRTDLGSFKSGHGLGASPIVYQDLVMISHDQDGPSALLALDSSTGKIRWKVPRKARATYTTPCIYQPTDRPAEILFTNYEHGITSLDPLTGRLNWEVEVFDQRHLETSIASPVVAQDLLLASSGYLGVRQEVVAVSLHSKDPNGKPPVVYRIARAAPLCPTPLVKDDLLFLWNDSGMVTCADVHTGAVHWQERVPGNYYSSPICIGQHLYNISREGEVIVLAAGKRYELIARNPAGEGSHSTPAVADGTLYVRTFSHLISLGGTAKKPPSRKEAGP